MGNLQKRRRKKIEEATVVEPVEVSPPEAPVEVTGQMLNPTPMDISSLMDFVNNTGMNPFKELTLIGPISNKTVAKVATSLSFFEKADDLDPVIITMCTRGGSVSAALAIADLIRTSPLTIGIRVIGECMSAGIIILAAGDVRFSGSLTTFMTHECSYGTSGKNSENADFVKQVKIEMTRVSKFLASRTKKSAKFWDNKGTHIDFYFSAEKALEYGLLDKILDDKDTLPEEDDSNVE